ncbi:hypothetical protein CDIK_4522, partial [Cucumispora dikerogammari]
MPEITKAKSKRGREVRIFNDFVFNFESKSGEEVVWRCVNIICRSRLTTIADDKVVKHTEHSHEAEKLIAESYICNTRLKTLAKSSSLCSSKIITEITKGYDNQGVLNLPKRKVMLNLTGRVRNNEIPGFVPTQCDLPEGLRKNHRGEVFVRFDSYDESGSQEN